MDRDLVKGRAGRRRQGAGWPRAAWAALAVGLSGPAAPSWAAPLELGTEPYPYVVVQQDVAAVLREFGTNLNLRVNISPEVRGRVTARLAPLAPVAFLDRLAKLHGFEWYFDGTTLHISSVRETQTRFLALDLISFDRFKESLATLGIADARYGFRRDGDANVVLVTGPPRYVVMVEQSLAALVADERSRPRVASAAPRAPAAALPTRNPLLVFRGSQVQVLPNGRLP